MIRFDRYEGVLMVHFMKEIRKRVAIATPLFIGL